MSGRTARGIQLFVASALLVVALSREASAYIDPASGSYILQLLIAGLVGAGFAVKIFWKNIMAFFSGGPSRKDKTVEVDKDQTDGDDV
jgi:hypothetical protein